MLPKCCAHNGGAGANGGNDAHEDGDKGHKAALHVCRLSQVKRAREKGVIGTVAEDRHSFTFTPGLDFRSGPSGP